MHRLVILLLFSASLFVSTFQRANFADDAVPNNPQPRWWKGNLHTHTLWSDGDDFPEMRLATYLLGRSNAERDRLASALRCYADTSFWETDIPEATLAFYDRGEVARLALLGKTDFATHRD